MDRDFADMSKWRILRWRYYPGLSWWVLNAITCIFIRGIWRATGLHREEKERRRRKVWWCQAWRLEECDINQEISAEAGRGKGHILHYRGSVPQLTTWLWPSDNDFRLLTSWSVTEQVSLALSHHITAAAGLSYMNHVSSV